MKFDVKLLSLGAAVKSSVKLVDQHCCRATEKARELTDTSHLRHSNITCSDLILPPSVEVYFLQQHRPMHTESRIATGPGLPRFVPRLHRLRAAAAVIGLMLSFPLHAAYWYVAKEATSGFDGTTWATAWTNFSAIQWQSIKAGDTVWISGGPMGTTNVYIGDLSSNNKSPNSGTANNPVTIKVAQDSSHNGLVYILGSIFLTADYTILDGSKSSWIPSSVMDTYHIGTNINIEVNCNESGNNAVQMFGTGSKLHWVHVSQLVGNDNNAIQMVDAGASHPVGNGSEIAYCWVSQANGFGMRCEMANFVADSYGQLSVHHNIVEGTDDNYMQFSGHVDVFKNITRNPGYPTMGHPDNIQEIAAYTRFYDNICSLNQGAGFYLDYAGTSFHDIICYNNVFYWIVTTNTSNPGDLGVSLSNSAADSSGASSGNLTPVSVYNFWMFNNTFVYNTLRNDTIPKVFGWNSGLYRSTATASNLWVINNLILGKAPYNDQPILQFMTNTSVINGGAGFAYSAQYLPVDYNSVGGMSGNGQGISYGKYGSPNVPLTPYPSMTAFGADTGYTHNNNNAVTFVSLTNFDFRVGGADTAAKGLATNLTALLSPIAPECTNDIIGNFRSSSWDIGAYQSDPTLKLWISFNNGQTLDDAQGHTPYQFNTTNDISYANGPDGLGGYFHYVGIMTNAPPAVYPLSQYIAITNVASFEYLTNATFSFWAKFATNTDGGMCIFSSGFSDVYAQNTSLASNSWSIARNTSPNLEFLTWPQGQDNPTAVLSFPTDVIQGGGGSPNYGTTNVHLYTVTVACANNQAIAYYDGQPWQTNTINTPWLHIYGCATVRWLCIGAYTHDGTPQWGDDPYPNSGFFVGTMDDIRIYNRALTAAEVSNLYTGAGASMQSQTITSQQRPRPPTGLVIVR